MAREAATMAETDCRFQKTILNRRRRIVREEERRRGGDADLDVVVPEYCSVFRLLAFFGVVRGELTEIGVTRTV
ncbi:unnamed protein product [Sphagnum troendelagicum]|uniref:Uncharacterized protein n=1 Tax=Sphagnum troendelagicum TaxID=128251 RepID=A0ABP0UQS1_9BRYO